MLTIANRRSKGVFTPAKVPEIARVGDWRITNASCGDSPLGRPSSTLWSAYTLRQPFQPNAQDGNWARNVEGTDLLK